MGLAREIFKAFVTVSAEGIEAVKAQLRGVGDSASDMADNVDAHSKRASDRFIDFADNVDKGTKRATRALGDIAAPAMAAIGTFVAVFAGVQKVAEAFESGADRAEKFKASLDMTDVAGSVKKLGSELADIESRLSGNAADALQNLLTKGIIPRLGSQLQEELDSLRQTELGMRQQLHAQELRDKERKAKEEEAKGAEIARRESEARDKDDAAFTKRARDRRIETLSEEEQIRAKAEATISDLRDQFDQANTDTQRQAVLDMIATEYELRDQKLREYQSKERDARIKALQDEARERERIEEDNRRAFESYVKELTAAAEKVAQAVNDMNQWNQQIMNQNVQLVYSTNAIQAAVNRIPGLIR